MRLNVVACCVSIACVLLRPLTLASEFSERKQAPFSGCCSDEWKSAIGVELL